MTLAYVNAVGSQVRVRCATTAQISRSGLMPVDGVTLSPNDAVLVKDQAVKSQNGVWYASAAAWSRSPATAATAQAFGYDQVAPPTYASGLLVHVTWGAENGGSIYVLTTADPVAAGTTALTFVRATPKFTDPDLQVMLGADPFLEDLLWST